MKFPFPTLVCTMAVLGFALAVPPAAEANPLKSIGSGLKKLNPFKKTPPKAEPVPTPSAPAKPKAKPAAKTAKSSADTASSRKKKGAVSTAPTKKAGAAVAAGTAAATGEAADETDPNKKPDPTKNTAEEASADSSTPPAPADAKPAAPAEIPFATPVMGRKGHVRSPFAEDQGMVDVTDIPAGSRVKCPFTGKIFRVP